MWHYVSPALVELENLAGFAYHHKQLCDSPDCNVSLHLLKQTARRLLVLVSEDERDQARKILEAWPS